MEPTMTTAAEPKKRISKTMKWARDHVGVIYEVTDPEPRALLCNYRDKDKQHQEEQVEVEECETVDAIIIVRVRLSTIGS